MSASTWTPSADSSDRGHTHPETAEEGGREVPRGHTILLAEDKTDQREMLTTLLEGSGYHVTAVPDGARALQHIKHQKFDLVILDIMMPKADGVKICNKIKHARSRAQTPVLIISALAKGSKASEDVWRQRTLADAFVAKPFDMRKLLKTVADLLAHPISEEEAREKSHEEARLKDLTDLIETGNITDKAQLRATRQEISTQYFHKFDRPRSTRP